MTRSVAKRVSGQIGRTRPPQLGGAGLSSATKASTGVPIVSSVALKSHTVADVVSAFVYVGAPGDAEEVR